MESMTLRARTCAAAAILLLAGFCVVPAVHAQLADPVQRQATGEAADRIEPDDDRAASRAASGQAGAAKDREAAMRAELRRMLEQRRRELLPEYERRVRVHGRSEADAWLKRVATEMGRNDGAEIRARFGH